LGSSVQVLLRTGIAADTIDSSTGGWARRGRHPGLDWRTSCLPKEGLASAAVEFHHRLADLGAHSGHFCSVQLSCCFVDGYDLLNHRDGTLQGKHYRELGHLDLAGCSDCIDDCPLRLAEGLPQLRCFLSLARSRRIPCLHRWCRWRAIWPLRPEAKFIVARQTYPVAEVLKLPLTSAGARTRVRRTECTASMSPGMMLTWKRTGMLLGK
jgi:hypothetical protein